MQKNKFTVALMLILAALFSASAADETLNGMQYGVPKWAKNKAVTVRHQRNCAFQVKAKDGAAIAPWNVRAVLPKGTSYSLDGKKAFFVTAKLLANDKPAKISVIIARKCPGDKDEARFLTEITVNPGDAQTFRIPLRTGSAHGKRTGVFVPTQGKQCDLHLENGGALRQLIFCGSAEAEFSRFGFSDAVEDSTPAAGSLGAKLEKEMAAHKLHQPYQFAELIQRDDSRRQALDAVRGKYNILSELPEWSFRTDPDNKGEKENWAAKGSKGWVPIRAGANWESQGFKNYDGFAWYKRTVELPGPGCSLFFLSVDETAWVYLDGKFIGGQYEGHPGLLWNKPFFVEIPADAGKGKHTLAVRVHDTSGQGGIWQPVFLVQKKEAK